MIFVMHALPKSYTALVWASYREWEKQKVTEELYCKTTGKLLTLSIDMGAELMEDRLNHALDPGLSKNRKYAIEYFHRAHYGKAPEAALGEFDGLASLPRLIMRHLGVPRGSYALVVEVMHDVIKAVEKEEAYKPSARINGTRGAKPKIEDMTEQAKMVYRTMETGLSLGSISST